MASLFTLRRKGSWYVLGGEPFTKQEAGPYPQAAMRVEPKALYGCSQYLCKMIDVLN